MKKFIQKLFIFVFILFVLLVSINIAIPAKALVYRPWEAILFAKLPVNAPFYPNKTIDMHSVGDLCHHRKDAIVRKETWRTDALGYRNDKHITNADILLIGDSFIVGTSLDQADILSHQISKIDSTLIVYNMAPSSFSQFDRLLKIGKINKPKQIIFSIVERNLPEKIQHYNASSKKETLKNTISYSNITCHVDYFLKFFLFKWIKARVNNAKGNGIKGVNDSKMYFFEGQRQQKTKIDLVNTITIVKSYKAYCDSLDIPFFFMPMPDKETVYFEKVPFDRQSDYLFQLDSALVTSGISTINTLKIYNDYRNSHTEMLYQLDDTHWNSNATQLIANEIVHKLQKKSK